MNKTRRTKQEKGITLVALIITIIVLLILAVVSIRAVQGDGILQHAKNAKSATTEAQEQEQILLAVNEWKIQKNYQNEPGSFKSFMIDKLSDVATIPDSDPDAGPLTVTMKDTGNKYIVKDDGTIGEPWINNGYGTLTKGSETVKIGETTYDNDYVKDKLGATGGTYTGKWQVIGAEGDKLKLVSVDNVASGVKLGKTDENVYKTNEAGNPILDGEGNKILKDEIVNSNVDGDLELKKAAWSYAHAVDTLDEVAQKATKIESARSITIDDIYDIIGEEKVDKSSNSSYGETYKFYCDDTTCNNTSGSKVYSCKKNDDGTWTKGTSIASNSAYAKFTYANNKKETRTIGTLADGTTINKGEVELPNNYFNYTLTDPQKSAIGRLKTEGYWLASPCVNCGSSYADFYVRCMSGGNINSARLFTSTGYASNDSNGVRAVVSI